MRKAVLTLGIALSAVLAGTVAAGAANSSATIISCATATACYSPNPIQITVGSTVTWTNNHTLAHTATADTLAWDSGTTASGATSAPIAFTTPGTFTYHCRFHADMHGTIVVSAAAATTPAPTAAPTASPRVRTLAQGGGGLPTLPISASLVLVGLALLGLGSLRRKPPQP